MLIDIWEPAYSNRTSPSLYPSVLVSEDYVDTLDQVSEALSEEGFYTQ